METIRNKRVAEKSKEKPGVISKKQCEEEKKSKSDTITTGSGSSKLEHNEENIIVIGKSCSIAKSKLLEGNLHLHECRSETALNQVSEKSNLAEDVPCEGPVPSLSCASFISALSDADINNKSMVKDVQDFDNEKMLMNDGLPELEKANYEIASPLQLNFHCESDYVVKLKSMEKQMIVKDKRIKDLILKVQECVASKNKITLKNKDLTHQINILNRQLQSMYGLAGQKSLNKTINPIEFIHYKNKTSELEGLIEKLEDDKTKLKEKVNTIGLELSMRENELNSKNKEFIDYKTRSTLEMCKLISKIDCLKRNMKTYSEQCSNKIIEVQNSMDDELVRITTKLEDQYQKDLKSSIEKVQSSFKHLANFPPAAIEKLLDMYGLENTDWIPQQNEETNVGVFLMETAHSEEINNLRNNYENQIILLKTRIESLLNELNEKNKLIGVFENELPLWKRNPQLTLLKYSGLAHFSSLSELYTTEITAQNKIHDLEMNVFEKKVRTLTEEILYRAKNEENHLLELENAKKMVQIYREKYESTVIEWGGRIQKKCDLLIKESLGQLSMDDVFDQMRDFIHSLKKAEIIHEERVQKMMENHKNEIKLYNTSIEMSKDKINEMEFFQSDQLMLDDTIQDLIQKIGNNYIKTVDALVTGHATELSLKQLEMQSTEKRFQDEITSLKTMYEKKILELENKLEQMKKTKDSLENELSEKEQSCFCRNINYSGADIEELSLKLLKCEGLLAIKEETESALNNRVEELETLLQQKEENCRKEIENLMGKLIELKVVMSAKDDLVKDLEDKLNDFEHREQKSYPDENGVLGSCAKVDEYQENLYDQFPDVRNDMKNFVTMEEYNFIKKDCEKLNLELVKALETIDILQKENQSLKYNEKLNVEDKQVFENVKTLENDSYLMIDFKNDSVKIDSPILGIPKGEEKLIIKLKRVAEGNLSQIKSPAEIQTNQTVLRRNLETSELEEEFIEGQIICSKNQSEVGQSCKILLGELRIMNKKMIKLIRRIVENKKKPDEDGRFAMSLHEVKVLYEEDVPLNLKESNSKSSVSCQVESDQSVDLVKSEDYMKEIEELKKENQNLISQLNNYKLNDHINEEGMMIKLQKELFEVINEKNRWMTLSTNLEGERQNLSRELAILRDENLILQEKFKAYLKIVNGKSDARIGTQETSFKENKIYEMKCEIEQLSKYVKTLSFKLDDMKARNEILLIESSELLKNQKNDSSMSSEKFLSQNDWTEEDQRKKVTKENVLVNLSGSRSENSSAGSSNVYTESRPYGSSWIKIHETIESIVDEVLALKTSFGESNLVSETYNCCEAPKLNSELKLMSDVLDSQMSNKTFLCDELLNQKRTLEGELKNLEQMLKENDSRIWNQKRFSGEKKLSDFSVHNSGLNRFQMNSMTETEKSCQHSNEMPTPKNSEDSHFETLVSVKKSLEDRILLGETQCYKNLKHEVQKIKNEIQELETILNLKKNDLKEIATEEERDLTLIEISYEEEVLNLLREFKIEMEELKSTFSRDIDLTEKSKEENGEKFICEIYKMQDYFAKKYKDLRKRYYGISNTYNREKLNNFLEKKRQQIIRCFQKILQTEDREIQKAELEIFTNDIINKLIEEIKLLQNRYKENLIEHSWEIEGLQAVIAQLKENMFNKKENTDLQGVCLECEEKSEQRPEDMVVSTGKLKKPLKIDRFEKNKYTCNNVEITIPENGIKVEEETKTNSSALFSNFRINTFEEKCNSEKMQSHSSLFDAEAIVSENGNLEDELFSRVGRNSPEIRSQSSFLNENQYFGRNEIVTDDGKLEIIRERDSLKDMVLSLRTIVSKLLTFISQPGKSLSESTVNDCEETLYKSLLIDNQADFSLTLNNFSSGLEVSTIIQEICSHSLLNSSENLEFEVDRYLNKIKEDAVNVLSLSNPEVYRRLKELVGKVEEEKNHLQVKVQKLEEAQVGLKEEVEITKNKLAMLERNLEVVSEGYGEEVIEPKKVIFTSDLKNKMKISSGKTGRISGSIPSMQDTTFLEEVNEEGYVWQEEWKKERSELQKQIDVADKQLQSLRKFMEEQAAERELEREAFDKEINDLKENLKLKERDTVLSSRTNQEIDVLESQIKELTVQIENLEYGKSCIESEFQGAVKKIWSLREVIQDLEVQLAECNERESLLKKKIEKLDEIIKEQTKVNASLKEEFEVNKNEYEMKFSDHIKNLEEERTNLRRIVDQINPQDLVQMKSNLRQIENLIIKKTKDLEQWHTTSANVSCSSLSEDVSVRDHFDATRCCTPDEMSNQFQNLILPLEEVDRLQEKLSRHTRAEEVALKTIKDLKMQLERSKKSCEELLTERDVLLERVDLYLKENSNLKARLEEHRCNAALQQKKLNADLESQIRRLEADWEKLNELCTFKDQQLEDLKKILENTTKALNLREAEFLNKQKEENLLISTLKADLTTALNEKEILEHNLEEIKEKLRSSIKIPALIQSVFEEKNAEIDRLEKEVSRLSNEKSSLERQSKSLKENFKIAKGEKRIKFSEPESFEECLSTISPYFPSSIRNCSDSFADFKNSSFKIRQPLHYSKEVESLSSIGPLQLSPRGKDFNTNWKTSSPIVPEDQSVDKIPSKIKIDEESKDSKLVTEIESKKTEILNLQLEIDTLKRQLTESNQELETQKTQLKEIQEAVELKDEEIIKYRENETNLTGTIETLKKRHVDEIDELQNKLCFERGKVEKIYGEIKDLEIKKNEIEEAFYNLKDEYKEKSCREQKMVKVLVEKVKELESKNFELRNKVVDMKEKIEIADKEANGAIEVLRNELIEVKKENENFKKSTKSFSDVQIQVEHNCFEDITTDSINWPKLKSESILLKENLAHLKLELNKMMEALMKVDFNKKDLDYLSAIKNILQKILGDFNSLLAEFERQRKMLSKSAIDLPLSVQKEISSTSLDNKFLSGCETKNINSKENSFSLGSENLEVSNQLPEAPNSKASDNCHLKVIALCEKETKVVNDWKKEKCELIGKIQTQEKVIKHLEENLTTGEQRMIAEKERYKEDAKIMELLRIKLEKGFDDIKSKDRELKREKQLRVVLEKENEALKKRLTDEFDNKINTDLNRQLLSQEEKLTILNQSLENEKIKNKELQLLLEKEKLKRLSEKETQKLWESDFSLIKELKENFKSELFKTKHLLHSRDKEISILKRKINLQEIDIKALSLSNDYNQQYSSGIQTDECERATTIGFRENSEAFISSENFLLQMKKLNNCIWRRAQGSNETGEAILHLSEETEEIKDRIKKLEQTLDLKLADETLVADGELDRRLWELERGKLLMDLETLRTENELVKRNSIETYKKSEFLQLENSKLKAEIKLLEEEATSRMEIGILRERAGNLLGKYLRAESYRKALVWQKQYLTITLNGYKSSEEEMRKKIGKWRNKKRETKPKSNAKFRLISLVIIAIIRMKFIMRRWQKHKTASVLDTHIQIANQNLSELVVNRACNEPLNPLTYQSQNLFCSNPNRVPKSPPSRDPGLQSCISNSRLSVGVEPFVRLQETKFATKILP